MSAQRPGTIPSGSGGERTAAPLDPPRTPSRRRWLGRLAAPLTAALGGAAAYFSFPHWSWWWLAPLSVTLLLLAVRGRRVRVAAGLGYLYGWVMLAPLLSWTSIQVGPLPWLALVALEACFPALAAAAISLTLRLRRPVVRPVAAACCWVAAEALQGRIPFGGFGWSRFAFSQADAPTLGWAAIGGAPLVSFAVALTGAALAEAVIHARAGQRRGIRAAGWLVAALLVLGSGALVPRPTAAQEGTVQVAGIQGNVPRMGLEFNAERRAVLDNHARLTHELADQVAAGAAPAPDLVVWPENSSDIDPFTNPDAYRVIDAAVAAAAAPTLVGTLVYNSETGLLRNTVLVWEPGPGPTAGYAKRAPVPFAEYVPYRSFFRAITPLVDQAGNFEAGDAVGVLDVPTTAGTVRAGVLICFEVVPDRLVADVVDDGATVLIVPTNNATFGFTDESRQQLAVSRLRAVETGRAVAHVSTVGVSGMIAPDGTLIDSSPLFEPRILHGELPLRSTLTVASRVRSGPEWLLVGLAGLGVIAGVRARPGGRRHPSAEPTDGGTT